MPKARKHPIALEATRYYHSTSASCVVGSPNLLPHVVVCHRLSAARLFAAPTLQLANASDTAASGWKTGF